jgi:hypothetical protein
MKTPPEKQASPQCGDVPRISLTDADKSRLLEIAKKIIEKRRELLKRLANS